MDTKGHSICWGDHHDNMVNVFKDLMKSNSLVDCTLSAEGQFLQAHKVVLCACSPYFRTLFSLNTEKNPIVIFKDAKFLELKAVVDFMYSGEVNIPDDWLLSFKSIADSLQIKGLDDVPKKKVTRKEVNSSRRERSVSPITSNHHKESSDDPKILNDIILIEDSEEEDLEIIVDDNENIASVEGRSILDCDTAVDPLAGTNLSQSSSMNEIKEDNTIDIKPMVEIFLPEPDFIGDLYNSSQNKSSTNKEKHDCEETNAVTTIEMEECTRGKEGKVPESTAVSDKVNADDLQLSEKGTRSTKSGCSDEVQQQREPQTSHFKVVKRLLIPGNKICSTRKLQKVIKSCEFLSPQNLPPNCGLVVKSFNRGTTLSSSRSRLYTSLPEPVKNTVGSIPSISSCAFNPVLAASTTVTSLNTPNSAPTASNPISQSLYVDPIKKKELKKYICPECLLQFRTFEFLVRHVRNHKESLLVKCLGCNPVVKIGQHFRCPICEKEYALLSSLETHLRSHYQIVLSKCPRCSLPDSL